MVGKAAAQTAAVAVGKGAAGSTAGVAAPRRAFGEVTNGGAASRVAVDRTSKDSLNIAKPVTRSRTASANQPVAQVAPQPPSSTGTGLARLKIAPSSNAHALPTKSTRPARAPLAAKSSQQQLGAPTVAPPAPRLQQGEWAGAYAGPSYVQPGEVDDGAAGLGIGAPGADDWVAEQMAVDQHHHQPQAGPSVSPAVAQKGHKRTHDVELSDEEEDSAAQSAFSNGHRAGHHDDKVRIVDAGAVVDPDDWLALLCDEEEAEESERLLEVVKREFQEQVDWWDISMVAEYSEEIFTYMSELEEASMPNPRYMDHQTEIEWAMRTTLIDWLLQVHMRYHMLPETLWIAVNIIDRFLSNRVVSLVKFQLVGVTAMFIAAKYEEIMAPSVEEFVYMTEGGYSRDEILRGERIILQSLEFNVSSYCSPYSWVRRISKADDYDIQTRTLSKFLMEVTLLDHRFLRAKPSMIAAIGMYLARRMLGGDWNEAFIFYSEYTEAQLLVPAGFLLESIAAPGFEDKFVYKKYSNKKFLKASIFARNWARQNAANEAEV
ncbi:B-type cyclin [Rhodosporidiobolus nylandii]